ncbi:MAG: divalent-cation tolerance protein CutA [Proteobacteria bacterium]|nr:divalent-cation tolerance protein CutA [Pseudomonadota bacterium]
MSEIIKIIITADSKETAEKIGRDLVGRRLASCAQISGPIKSIYWWKGKIEAAEEWVCTLKSRKGLYKTIEREIRVLHPYELPQIIAIDIPHVLPEYADWIQNETVKGEK